MSKQVTQDLIYHHHLEKGYLHISTTFHILDAEQPQN